MAAYTKLSLERLAKAWLPLSHQYLMPELIKSIMLPIKILAVAGCRESVQAGLDANGRPFKPLVHNRPDGGNKPLLDKGLLAASISAAVTQEGIELKASHPGAAVHQFGATIRAKKKFLTIPVTTEAKRAGGARRFPRDLFFVSSRQPNTGLLCEGGPNGGLRVHYVLKQSVKIPARAFLGFSPATELKIVRLVADKAQALIAASFGGQK